MTLRTRFFAATYDRQMAKTEKAGLRAFREALLAGAAGDVPPGQITDGYLQVITTAWRQRHIDADLAGLRITDVATGPNPAGGSIPLWVGGSASPAIRRADPVRHRLAPDQPRPRLAGALRAARPPPGEPARRAPRCQASCPGSSSGPRPHQSPPLAGRSASARSPRSPKTSGSSPD